MSSFGDLLTDLSTKIQLKHKIFLMICLSLSVYTIISSETISLLIGFNRNYNKNYSNVFDNRLSQRRGTRRTDPNGNLLSFHLPNLTDYHIIYYYKLIPSSDQIYCHSYGTDWNQTTGRLVTTSDDMQCVCNEEYLGTDCGIPSVVYTSLKDMDLMVKRLSKPKRIVISVILLSINNSNPKSKFDLIDKTLKSLSDFVDLFIITEININDNKSKPIERQMDCVFNSTNVNISANNCLKSEPEWHDLKSMVTSETNRYSDIVLFSTLNLTAKQMSRIGSNGLHSYVMSKVWTISVRRVTDFRPNDIIIYMSSNSFPNKQILMFLKHYSGFPEPIKLVSHSEHRFEDRIKLDPVFDDLINPLIANNNKLVNIAVTFEYLSLLCRYELKLFKNNLCIDNEIKVQMFNETYWPVMYWSIGSYASNRSANVLLPFV